MKFYDKVKQSVDSLTDKVISSGNSINPIIRQLEKMLDLYKEQSTQLNIWTSSLYEFSKQQAPELLEGMGSFQDAFKNINKLQQNFENLVHQQVILPLEHISKEWDGLQTKMRFQASIAKKKEKSEQELEKKKIKRSDKLKPMEIENAEKELLNIQQQFNSGEQQLQKDQFAFLQLQNSTLSNALNSFWMSYKDFYQSALNFLA